MTDAELEHIDSLNKNHRYGGDPDNAWKDNPVPSR